MTQTRLNEDTTSRVIVIGAGIAGLAAAARLAQLGREVVVFERHEAPGGKIRCLPSQAGPVDAGPTVLTLRTVFDDLFAAMGERIEDHVTLVRQHLIARHFWQDGSRLDLFDDDDQNRAAVERFAGAKAARQFVKFSEQARVLFQGFDTPMMRAAEPSVTSLVKHVALHPQLAWQMAPLSTLHELLTRHFDDPRLVQLFGRYATYVGGSPYQAPAILSLIWQAERAGVWAVQGGIHKLARAIEALARDRGALFHYGAHVKRLRCTDGQVRGVELKDGTIIAANTVLFNGDPRALSLGALGKDAAHVAPQTRKAPRSLSADVWAFAAKAQGLELAHHNVFFRDNPKPEFDALDHGMRADDPTLYVCAMDRGFASDPPPLERFEIIANAPPCNLNTIEEDPITCQTRIFQTLARFGLSFDPTPMDSALTTPHGFDRLFPQTAGSLYGQSPHGTMAAFQRPTARTPITGLYLAGGGTHPGAGVPMATLSAQHAVAAILRDQTSTSMSRQMDMRGGMLTGSATTVTER